MQRKRVENITVVFMVCPSKTRMIAGVVDSDAFETKWGATMKHVPATLLFVTLATACMAEMPKCPAGYENQTWDMDMFGYCTRIPDLEESTQRAEAFVKSSLVPLEILTINFRKAKHHGDVGECDLRKFLPLNDKILYLTINSLRFTDHTRPHGMMPGAERLFAAMDKIYKANEEFAKEQKRYAELK